MFETLQKVGAIIGALKSGQIDAWSIVPHIGKALAGGAVQIIGDVASYLPDYQVTSADKAVNNRADTEAFIKAFSAGAADFNAALVDKTQGTDADEAMVELGHKYVYADRPFEKAAKSIRNGSMRINAGAALNVGSIEDQFQLNWFKAEGLVDKDITLKTLLDTSYVETT